MKISDLSLTDQDRRWIARAQLALECGEVWTDEECGCCGQYHSDSFTGDCRNDNERLPDPPTYLLDSYGIEYAGKDGPKL